MCRSYDTCGRIQNYSFFLGVLYGVGWLIARNVMTRDQRRTRAELNYSICLVAFVFSRRA